MPYQPIGKFDSQAGFARKSDFKTPVTFYDRVRFVGAASSIEIFGGVLSGSALTIQTDLISGDWDGTLPLSLPDGGAALGYALEFDTGIGQFSALYAPGANVTALPTSNLSGQVTTAQIENTAIIEALIADLAISTAKLQLLSVDTAQIATDAVTSGQIADNAVDTEHIQLLAITAAEIDALAVTTAKIAANAVDTGQLALLAVDSTILDALAVTTAKIALNAVDTAQIAADAVEAGQLADNAVGTEHVQLLAITEAEVAALAITNAKLGLLAVDTAQIQAGAVEAAKIGALAVETGKLALDAVTDAQLADLAVGGEHIQALSITAAKIAANTITAAQIFANTITAAEIAAGTITATEINAATITSSEIAANTITSGNILALTIEAGDIKANTITAAKIAANTITAAEIFAGTISVTEMAANSVDTSQLTALAVTAAKIAAGTITAAQIAAGTITATEILAGSLTIATLNPTLVASAFRNFVEDWSDSSLSEWTNSGGGTVATLQTSEAEYGGYVLDTDGYQQMLGSKIPFDPEAMYHLKVRFRRKTQGTNNEGSYVGIRTLDHAQAAVGANGGNHYILLSNYKPAGTGWETAEGYIQGHSIANASNSKSPEDPSTLIDTTSYMQPLLLVNYSTQDGGEWEFDYFTIEVVYQNNSITGTTIRDGVITTDHIFANTIVAGDIAANTITASEIAANAITTAELNALAVTAAKIAANTITAAQINAGTITVTEMAANSIDTSQLVALSVTASEIAANTITAGQIAANAINTDELNALAVTAAKIAVGTITATQIAAGTITATELNVTSLDAITANMGTLTIDETLTMVSGGVFATAATAPRWVWDIDVHGAQDMNFETGLTNEYLVGSLNATKAGTGADDYGDMSLRSPTLGDATNRGDGILNVLSDYASTTGMVVLGSHGYGTWDSETQLAALSLGDGDAHVLIQTLTVGSGAGTIEVSTGDTITFKIGGTQVAQWTNETWNTASLINSWVLHSATFNTPEYRKLPDGRIELRGMMKNGTTTANTTVFTLPTGYRPAKQILQGIYGAAGAARIDIKTNGDVQTNTNWSSSFMAIDCVFSID